MLSLHFEQPLWMLLLLAIVPMGASALAWLSGVARVRRWSAVLLRLVLIGLIAGSLAGMSMVRTSSRLAVIAVIDLSGSVRRYFDAGTDGAGRPVMFSEAARSFLKAAMMNRRVDDLLGVVVFDGRALAVAAPTTGDPLALPLEAPDDVGGAGGVSSEGTNIEAGLRLARAMIPAGATGRIILFSDGNQTAGNALAEAARNAGSGRERTAEGGSGVLAAVPVDVVPLNYSVSGEVIVESVDAPPMAPADATITVRVVLNATDAATGTLTLLREGQPVDLGDASGSTGPRARRVTLGQGRNVELLTVRLPPGRVHRFEAIFEADREGSSGNIARADRVAVNNRAEAFTLTPGKGSVLIVDGVGGGDPGANGAVLARTIRGAGIDATLIAPQSLRPDPLELQPYDLVILQNVAADALTRPVQELLASYVSELGGGLVMVGGPDSFGAGGWKGTPIEPLLPVTLDLPERLVVPAAAVVIVLDRSGSMNARVTGSRLTQQKIAAEGAAVAIRSMDRADLVGVISFSDDMRVDVPLGANTNPDRSAAIVRDIWADGGTILPPALIEAERQLDGVRADVKHIIVLSDGRSQGTEELPALAQKLRADGIKVSTIAVGDAADTEALSELAATTDGRFYRVIDPNLLPRIFVKAVRVIRTPLIREQPFTPVIGDAGSPVLEGVGPIPTLGGMVLTQARKDRTVSAALLAPTGEPVLSTWSAGLGKVGAFTSDAHRWAADWVPQESFARFWTQLVRFTARPPADRTQELSTEILGDRLLIRLEASGEDARPLDLLTVPGTVFGPTGERADVRLAQSGPGIYEGSVPAPVSGSYVVALRPRMGSRALAPVLGGATRPIGSEFRTLTSNVPLLRELAHLSGGRVLALADPLGGGSGEGGGGVFEREGLRPAVARIPLWRTLMLWAVVVMLLDVATRRVAWDRAFSREFNAEARREEGRSPGDRGARAGAAMSRLRTRVEGIPEPRLPDLAPALGIDDAREIVRLQAERRRQARESVRSGSPVAERVVPKPEQVAEDAPVSGLLEAKRRARRQMEDSEDVGLPGA